MEEELKEKSYPPARERPKLGTFSKELFGLKPQEIGDTYLQSWRSEGKVLPGAANHLIVDEKS